MTSATVRVPVTLTAGDGGEDELAAFVAWLSDLAERRRPAPPRAEAALERLTLELVRAFRQEVPRG